jgi:hypothetical protein
MRTSRLNIRTRLGSHNALLLLELAALAALATLFGGLALKVNAQMAPSPTIQSHKAVYLPGGATVVQV